MTDKTLPKSIRTTALNAIATIHAWNAAVHAARSREALDDCIGRYEYDLVTGSVERELGHAEGRARQTLDRLVEQMRARGMSPAQFYAALGTARPEVVTEGPRVCEWHVGQR